MSPHTPQTITLESGLDGLLGNSAAYDFLDSAVAVFDIQGTLRYGNTAFSKFNHAVRDSVQNLNKQAALLDCPQFRSWLLDSVAADHVKSLRQIFYYAPLIQVELTVYARPVVTPGGKTRGIPVSYTHLRAHETRHDLVCRLLLE